MSFKVEWSSRALKQARRLDEITRARVLPAINKFAASGQGDVKRLQGTTNVYRLRVGDWRIIFELDAAMGRISIDAALPPEQRDARGCGEKPPSRTAAEGQFPARGIIRRW